MCRPVHVWMDAITYCHVGDDVAAGGAANRHGRDGERGGREGESLVLS